MSDEKKNNKVQETASSSSSSFSVQIDTVIITQLHVNQLHLFHRIIEIADEVDDLHECVNIIELTISSTISMMRWRKRK